MVDGPLQMTRYWTMLTGILLFGSCPDINIINA